MDGRSIWTAADVEALKTMWAAGNSCSEIARALGPDFSRCSVSGKAWRMGLAERKTGIWKRPASAGYERKPRKLKAAPPPPPELLPAIGEPETLLDAGQCKFIAGDVRFPGWRMCGHPTGATTNPWCPAHRVICFDKAQTAASIKRSDKREADIAQDRMMRRTGLG